MKIVVTLEPVMILTRNFDQELNLIKETHQFKKKIDDDVMLTKCDVIVFFLIYGQSAAIRKPDSKSMVFKT